MCNNNENMHDTDDLISRKMAIEQMAKCIWHFPGELYKKFNHYNFTEEFVKDALKDLPSVVIERNSNASNALNALDCVSRQAAINTVLSMANFADGDFDAYKDVLVECFKVLPSAQPEIIKCKDCQHNGSFDTDCPIDWNGKEYCSFARRREND